MWPLDRFAGGVQYPLEIPSKQLPAKIQQYTVSSARACALNHTFRWLEPNLGNRAEFLKFSRFLNTVHDCFSEFFRLERQGAEVSGI